MAKYALVQSGIYRHKCVMKWARFEITFGTVRISYQIKNDGKTGLIYKQHV